MQDSENKSVQINADSQLQALIYQKQRNLEAIFDAVPIGMLLIDNDLTVRRVNDAVRQITGKNYPELIDRKIGDCLGCVCSLHGDKGCGYGQECSECILTAIIECVTDLHQPLHRVPFKFDDGKVVSWFSVSAVPAAIDNDNFVVVSIDNVTVQKNTEEKLKETMRMKSQFISTVSHELRTPLACMKESITIVLDQIAGKINPEQRKFLDIAKRNVDRLARLINEVLDFQRLDSGIAKCNMQLNKIDEPLKDVYETMLTVAKCKNIHLFLEIDSGLPKSIFDKDQIIQVFTNLVNNAIKFTPENGRICIRAGKKDQQLRISVEDTGMGIPAEELPKIFDRFYRVYRPGKEIPGTGLGLAIVHKIVMLHHGRIEVESELDKGTAITVFLPITDKSPSSADDQLLEKTL